MLPTTAPALAPDGDHVSQSATKQSRKQKRWTRTGCERCKRLHTKCDEQKPHCLRCKRGGHACSYRPPRPWLFEGSPKKEPDQTDGAGISSSTPPSIMSPPKRPGFHPTASRNINFFMLQAEAASRGIMGSWDLPYALHLYSNFRPFRHLLNAFTESMLALWHSPSTSSKEFYFSSLDAAIREMRSHPSWLDRGANEADEALLHCCGLLTICELLRTMDATEVTPHLDALDEILERWRRGLSRLQGAERTRRVNLIDKFSRRVLALRRSHLVLFAIAQQKHASLETTGRQNLKTALAIGPDGPIVAFRSMTFAMGKLKNLLTNAVGVTLKQLSVAWWVKRHGADVRTLEAGLALWKASFDQFVSRTLLSAADMTMARFLRAHWVVAVIAAALCEVNIKSERKCLQLDHLFQGIIDAMDAVVGPGTAQGLNQPARLLKYKFLGFIPPLFFVATRCRCRSIRDRALKLLKMLEIHETVWNSRVAYEIAVATLEVEEQSLGARHPKTDQQPINSSNKHDEPFVRGLSISCYFEVQTKTANLSFRYLDMSLDPPVERVAKRVVEDEGGYEACRSIQYEDWPLDPVIKTFGYACHKLIPYVFLQTEESVSAFLNATNP